MGFHLVDCRPAGFHPGTAHSAQPVIADELDLAGWIDVASWWFDYHFRRFGAQTGDVVHDCGRIVHHFGWLEEPVLIGRWLKFVQRIRRGQEVEHRATPCSGDSQGVVLVSIRCERGRRPRCVVAVDSQSNPWGTIDSTPTGHSWRATGRRPPQLLGVGQIGLLSCECWHFVDCAVSPSSRPERLVVAHIGRVAATRDVTHF